MSLSMRDAQIFSRVLKNARAANNLTQAECAELLDFSLSFQKDLERCRCSTSLAGFYHICRTLNISADDCIFPGRIDNSNSSYHQLLRLIARCNDKQLDILLATAHALVEVKLF
jgi:transcriptional regulator with XRE-family HTH domain